MYRARGVLRQLGGQWTKVHGYFANMGGFVLESPERANFPLSSAAVEVFVKEGLIDVPDITEDEIKDRSKTDAFARLFAGLQVSRMAVQCIARRSAQLYVTPLEFITALSIGISIFTHIFEWAKPKDVNMPVVIRCFGKLDDGLSDRLSEKDKHVHGDERANVINVKRIPFGAMVAFMLEGGIKEPKHVVVLLLAISITASMYNGAHFWVRHELLTSQMVLV